jgi:hypothetical protein
MIRWLEGVLAVVLCACACTPTFTGEIGRLPAMEESDDVLELWVRPEPGWREGNKVFHWGFTNRSAETIEVEFASQKDAGLGLIVYDSATGVAAHPYPGFPQSGHEGQFATLAPGASLDAKDELLRGELDMHGRPFDVVVEFHARPRIRVRGAMREVHAVTRVRIREAEDAAPSR